MNSARAEKLFQYDYWANALIINSIKENIDRLTPEPVQILSHITGARQVWYNRIFGIASGNTLMQKTSIQELEHSNDTLTTLWIDLIHKQDPASMMIEYKNFEGQVFTTLLSDIITHVVNHGSYHRGQISRLIRESGGIPPATDYIVFVRQ